MDKKGKYLTNFGEIYDVNKFTIKRYIDDGYFHTSPSVSFPPNYYGLYNVAGNVSEWTSDTFIDHFPMDSLGIEWQMTYEDDFKSAFRKTYVYQHLYRQSSKSLDSTKMADIEQLTWFTDINMHNARVMHINPHPRFVKGGNWSSSTIYLIPGVRQIFSEDKSSCRIGFRLAMSVFKENKPQ